ncbi:BREX-4 system phosphatase PglZ [Clostridium bowmanii]|uniref:BREX-4 system phosphatase PglZ n=1 Tax=Clostridium bowmanii TaxID=132925 RepID=UPI001C0D0652|nr:BREX-4 system phosphatase PglZ [Clostridium bowmanii]MBU3188739.1 BREX-4 system phosphatase PglZ [Clostridium bowmanii]MCA1073324.1 BREX-4 system phosphatase PglZ [Clostridium bowmanii]
MIVKSASEAILKIRQHMSSEVCLKMMLIVNVNNQHDYMIIKNSIADEITCIKLSRYATSKDGMPDVENCISDIRTATQNSLVLGLSQHWKLLGENTLSMGISNILSIRGSKAKIIVLCYKLEHKLKQYLCEDKRLDSSICLTRGVNDELSKLYFVQNDISFLKKGNLVYGYASYLDRFENFCESNLIVSSSLYKSDFAKSLFDVKAIEGGFDLLGSICELPSHLIISMGNDDYWTKLCDDIGQVNIYNYLENEFGDLNNLHNMFYLWGEWNDYQKWKFYIGLQIGTIKNTYLSYVIENSPNYENFSENIFSKLLDLDIENKDYRSMYDQRKQILRYIVDLDAINNFVKKVKIKGNKKIFYLTDLTSVEREEIIEWLSNQSVIDDNIKKIIYIVYEDLSAYMKFFDLKNEGLNNYFSIYKLQKINNKIYDGFIDIVNTYAKTREYNKLIPTRNEVFEKIDKTDSTIFFVDALGVEFLGFISVWSKKIGLNIDVTIAKANIPTTTYNNKGFLDEYKNILVDIPDLDKLKHSGESTFNYQKTKLPIHIPVELELIKDILTKIKSELSRKAKVILVSDHGASRLVVINNKKISFNVESNGTKGGRCCKFVEGMQIPEFATIENGQLTLANYERFSCYARVETHGGATLEELIVPIIILTNSNDKVSVTLIENVIESSFRNKAELKVFVTQKSDSIRIRINNKDYHSTKFDGDFFIVPIHDITKIGKYLGEVYIGDNYVDNIFFSIKKSETKERDLGI